ncbi:hypothetical protein JL720_16422 [Aureococcus anophagefferens]|nr:hypothetical protein JL720_16422 [Aureococcus anophagefferens]
MIPNAASSGDGEGVELAEPEPLRHGRRLRRGGDESTFLAFHRLGQYCASATADGALKLIDAVNGCVKKTVHCRKYGVAAGCFAHHEQSLLVAGAAATSTIRHLSLYDNRYVRAFAGHDAPVTSVEPSPADDTFLSCGADGRVVLWDLAPQAPSRRSNWTAWADRKADAALAAQAADGVVFAVGASSADRRDGGLVKVYDAQVRRAPAAFSLDGAAARACAEAGGGDGSVGDRFARGRWTSLEFSPDGDKMVVATDGGAHRLRQPGRRSYCSRAAAVAGLRDDGDVHVRRRSVVAGCEDAKIRVWDAEKRCAAALRPRAPCATSPARGSTAYASCCASAVLWLAD